MEQKFTAMAALQELIESKAMADLVGAKSFSGVNAVVPVPLMLRSICDDFLERPFQNPHISLTSFPAET